MIAYEGYFNYCMQRVSGSVIIENNKILLLREKKAHGSGLFMLPGGKFDPELDKTDEDTCRREAKEELGIDIDIIEHLCEFEQIRPEKEDEIVLLVTYLAKRKSDVKPGEHTLEWGWFDVNNLPENTAPNISTCIETYKEKYT